MSRTYIYIVFSLLLLFSAPAHTFGMELYWDPGPNTQLVLSGEIKIGDAQKFRTFIVANFEKYKQSRFVRLASNGGDLVETLRIAQMLKSIYPNTIVDGERCASSCFFLYLSGVDRFAMKAELIGIHRAYFEPSYFAKLSPAAAKAKQTKLQRMIDNILDENEVPQYLRETMNRTSSAEIYWLSAQDVKNLGGMPAWFEEILIARCEYGSYKMLWRRLTETPKNDPTYEVNSEAAEKSLKKSLDCERDYINKELSTLPAVLTH